LPNHVKARTVAQATATRRAAIMMNVYSARFASGLDVRDSREP